MVQAWVMQTTRYKFCNSQRNSPKFLSGLKFELPTVVPSQLGVAKDAEEAPGEEEPQAKMVYSVHCHTQAQRTGLHHEPFLRVL